MNSWSYFLGGGGAKAALKTSRIRKKVLMAIVRCDKATLVHTGMRQPQLLLARVKKHRYKLW